MAVRDGQGDSQSPGRSRWTRPAVLVPCLVLVALLLAVAAFVTLGGGKAASPSRAGSQPAGGGSAGSRGAPKTGCAVAASVDTVPSLAPPPGTQWKTVGSIRIPQAPALYGPGRTSGVWNTCFAHDPSGALLAAINLWAESTTSAPATQVFQRLAVGVPRGAGVNPGLAAGGPLQFAGYEYLSYTPASAQISVVMRGAAGKLVAIDTEMVWNANDWKYLVPAGGQPAPEVIQDMRGYVPWSDF